MERLEELLMDMIDDGPLEESANASEFPVDAELRNELQRIHAQSPLLAQCIEYPSDSVRAALQAQKAALRTTLFQPRYSIGTAGLWGGGVVALAILIQVAATNLIPPTVYHDIERTPVVQQQPAVEQPARRSDEGIRSTSTSTTRTSTGTIESRIERSALLQRRNELRARLVQTNDPASREQIKRDLRRIETLVK